LTLEKNSFPSAGMSQKFNLLREVFTRKVFSSERQILNAQ